MGIIIVSIFTISISVIPFNTFYKSHSPLNPANILFNTFQTKNEVPFSFNTAFIFQFTRSSYFLSISLFFLGTNRLAFCLLTTFFPVFSSISLLVFPAMVPPCLAITRLSSNVLGFFLSKFRLW